MAKLLIEGIVRLEGCWLEDIGTTTISLTLTYQSPYFASPLLLYLQL